MIELFRRKKPLRKSFFPRDERLDIKQDIYIKREGKATLRSSDGNISETGLYLMIPEHDLERGKKVEVVIVKKDGSIRQMTRMMGIIIRTDESGAALVTYKKQNMNNEIVLKREESSLQREFGEF